mmetsp:Transcript_35747/g.107789  ORF Transcript_35747/g.107789 Transcript_35747/m.107789 type:complete len:374 (+) Transcript_35747:82-1203(+)
MVQRPLTCAIHLCATPQQPLPSLGESVSPLDCGAGTKLCPSVVASLHLALPRRRLPRSRPSSRALPALCPSARSRSRPSSVVHAVFVLGHARPRPKPPLLELDLAHGRRRRRRRALAHGPRRPPLLCARRREARLWRYVAHCSGGGRSDGGGRGAAVAEQELDGRLDAPRRRERRLDPLGAHLREHGAEHLLLVRGLGGAGCPNHRGRGAANGGRRRGDRTCLVAARGGGRARRGGGGGDGRRPVRGARLHEVRCRGLAGGRGREVVGARRLSRGGRGGGGGRHCLRRGSGGDGLRRPRRRRRHEGVEEAEVCRAEGAGRRRRGAASRRRVGGRRGGGGDGTGGGVGGEGGGARGSQGRGRGGRGGGSGGRGG